MDKGMTKRYAALQAKIAALEGERDGLKIEILEAMDVAGVTKEKTIFGTFTCAFRTSYRYTSKIKELEEKLKLAKIKEEQQGTAKASKTTYLVFTAPKND